MKTFTFIAGGLILALLAPSGALAKGLATSAKLEFLKENHLVNDDASLKGKLTQWQALENTVKALSDEIIITEREADAPDVSPYINTATQKDLLPTFVPDKKLSRRDAVTIIMKSIGPQNTFETLYNKIPSPFKDIKNDPLIAAAFMQNIFKPKGKKFRPDKAVKPKEFYDMLYRATVQKPQFTGSVTTPPPAFSNTSAPTITTEPGALPDLVINNIIEEQEFGPDANMRSVLRVSVKNVGKAPAVGNFGLYDRPDWYNYKPAWNSSTHMGISEDPGEFALRPGRLATFELFGRCDGKTGSLTISVDPHYVPAPELVPAGSSVEDFTPPNEVVESDESNNTVVHTCEVAEEE